MAYSDRELLARIIQCEAGGEGENGMKAVASVVMNRVQASVGEYSRLGGSLRNVIFQPGQFDCATETLGGRYNPQNIYNMNPQNEHFGGGAGGGVKVTPVAFLVIHGTEVRPLFLSDHPDSFDKIASYMPEFLDKITSLFSKDSE